MSEPRNARDELRVELLLALPDAGLERKAPADVDDDFDLETYRLMPGYSPEAVTALVLERLDAVVRAIEVDQAAFAEVATQGGVLSTIREFRSYLLQVVQAIRHGLEPAQAEDLARQMSGEAVRLSQLAGSIVRAHPVLEQIHPRLEGVDGRLLDVG